MLRARDIIDAVRLQRAVESGPPTYKCLDCGKLIAPTDDRCECGSRNIRPILAKKKT